MMFQGGFVGSECDLILLEGDDVKEKAICTLFPEDVNDLQVFKLSEAIEVATTQRLKLKFKKSSDFYGRITVYIVHFEGEI